MKRAYVPRLIMSIYCLEFIFWEIVCLHEIFLPLLLLLPLCIWFFFSSLKMKIAKYIKWYLLGIRKHFPFQWVNFRWLRSHYECGAFVFFPLFYFKLWNSFLRIWYDMNLRWKNFSLCTLYSVYTCSLFSSGFFLLPFHTWRLPVLLMWHTNKINSVQFSCFDILSVHKSYLEFFFSKHVAKKDCSLSLAVYVESFMDFFDRIYVELFLFTIIIFIFPIHWLSGKITKQLWYKCSSYIVIKKCMKWVCVWMFIHSEIWLN